MDDSRSTILNSNLMKHKKKIKLIGLKKQKDTKDKLIIENIIWDKQV